MDLIPITSVSVKVMRSHDYCHFEVVLGSDGKDYPSGMRSASILATLSSPRRCRKKKSSTSLT
jgi:hypothetical protein